MISSSGFKSCWFPSIFPVFLSGTKLFQDSLLVLAVDAQLWVVLPCTWEHGDSDSVGKSVRRLLPLEKSAVPRRALCLFQKHLPEGRGCLWGRGTGGSPTDSIFLVFSRILDIAKALRLRVSKAKAGPGLEDDHNHKLGTLSLPLPVQKAPEGQRKRRKMT